MNLHTGQVVFVIGLVTYLAVRAVFQRQFGGAGTKERRSSRLDRSLIAFVVVAQVVLPSAYVFTPWLDRFSYEAFPVATLLGAFAEVAGLWLFWRSHADLGRNWSVTLEVRDEHRLITRGVYAAIRHPMYASFLLMGVAQVLLLPNWVAGWAALAAIGLLCVVRVPREEAMMCEFFGDEYRAYMRKTGGVIPRFRPQGAA